MKNVCLKNIQAVDVHCHPYRIDAKPLGSQEFIRKLSLSVVPTSQHYVANKKEPHPGTNMWVQILLHRLAAYYSCEPDWDVVVEHRNQRATREDYTRELFRDARISRIVADFGYPQPPLSKDEYQAMCGVPLQEVFRIEPVMVRLRQEATSFGEFIEQYQQELRQALKDPQVVGLKSIIAYRSGLEVAAKNVALAKDQWEEFVAHERSQVKALRDYCLHLALEECTNADKVMHIHTGIGDGDVVLDKASPSFLLPLLRSPEYLGTKVHLVHGGYPWMEEAAFIVSILPNVYMDISLQNPFAGHGVERILSQVFEFAPFDKVLYGSDAFTVPEMNWLGVHLFKECFERVLQSWIDLDYMDVEMAQRIGEMVLYRNFERIYQNKAGEGME